MPNTISLEKDGETFVYRVAAVIIDDERVLLSRAKGDHFWSLPGGEAGFHEEAANVVRRTLREDLLEDIDVDRLVWVVENFFRDQKQNQKYHELSFYFLAHLRKDSEHLEHSGPFSGNSGQPKAQYEYQWFLRSEAELRKIPVYPLFLKYSLSSIPAEPEHVINQDRSM
jgi:ADP-ribose pyrophosphatase YjhB (NUDIX family)